MGSIRNYDYLKIKHLLIEDVCESMVPHFPMANLLDLVIFHVFLFIMRIMSTIEGGMICTNDSETYQIIECSKPWNDKRVDFEEEKSKWIQEYPDLNESLFLQDHPST